MEATRCLLHLKPDTVLLLMIHRRPLLLLLLLLKVIELMHIHLLHKVLLLLMTRTHLMLLMQASTTLNHHIHVRICSDFAMSGIRSVVSRLNRGRHSRCQRLET